MKVIFPHSAGAPVVRRLVQVYSANDSRIRTSSEMATQEASPQIGVLKELNGVNPQWAAWGVFRVIMQ